MKRPIFSWIFSILFFLLWISGVKEFGSWGFLFAGLILFPPLANFISKRYKFELSKFKKIVYPLAIIFVFVIIHVIIEGNSDSNQARINQQNLQQQQQAFPSQPQYIEISINELYSIFSDSSSLTDLQREEKFDQEFKNRIIKTSIRADAIDEASLSSKYVVRQMSNSVSCIVRAFFPSEEKAKLLNANVGDEIIIIGKFISADFGFASCITFEDSRVVKVIPREQSSLSTQEEDRIRKLNELLYG